MLPAIPGHQLHGNAKLRNASPGSRELRGNRQQVDGPRRGLERIADLLAQTSVRGPACGIGQQHSALFTRSH